MFIHWIVTQEEMYFQMISNVSFHLSIQSGALLACGIVNSGVRNECDPALALLSDYVLHNSNIMRIGAIFG